MKQNATRALDALRAFAIGKRGWIRRQQRRIREGPRQYLDRETYCVRGSRLLKPAEHDAPPAVTSRPRRPVLVVRPGSDSARWPAVLDD